MKTRTLIPSLVILLALVAGIVMVQVGGRSGAHIAAYNFSILRTPVEDARTTAGRLSLESLAVIKPHARFRNAQLADRRRDLWVLSTPQSLCIAQPQGASCAPKSVAISDGVILGTFRPPTAGSPIPHDFLLQGLVPDSVRRVLVVVGREHQLVIGVRQNVFSIERDKPVHVIRLLRAS